MKIASSRRVDGRSRPLDVVKRSVSSVVRRGDLAIDATAGNGHDTLLLARLVGPSGRVVAIDVQRDAIESATARLAEAGMAGRVSFVVGGHEKLHDIVASQGRTQVPSCIMFNLGYLPGSDKRIVTRPDTTRTALTASLSLLGPGGLLTVVVYPAHHGGREEAESVDNWMEAVGDITFDRMKYSGAEAPSSAAYAWIVRRRAEECPPQSDSSS